MCANRQTADDAILYKAVVPRTGQTAFQIRTRGRDALGTEKVEQTRGFPKERFEQFGWI